MIPIIEEQRKPSFGEQLMGGLGRAASAAATGIPQLIQEKKFKDLLIKSGATPEEAALYSRLTTGGKTAEFKELLEQKKRAQQVKENYPELEEAFPEQETEKQEEIEQKEKIISPKNSIKERLKRYLSERDVGLTPRERVQAGKERYSTGLKSYQEAGGKLRGLARDRERLDILDNLKKSKNLPTYLARLNVKKDGSLKLPFLATPEAQRFVKTLNEFSAGAKETYGARVTNFDLQQYMQRYPTLLNSAEGIQQIIDQMKIVNQINALYYKNLKGIYDAAGGVRNIDADIAEKFADQITDPGIKSLIKKFDNIGKPSAQEHQGKRIKDSATGEIFISDGNDWIRENG